MEWSNHLEKNIFRLDDFIINTNFRNIIGRGAYGIVYAATGPQKQKVAAKTINGKHHPRVLKQDVTKLMQLNHDNVVKIFRFHKQDETFWVFMEFCGYGDLNEYFLNKELQLSQKTELMYGIAKGISYLHSNNIIHRDVKPANILIASEIPLTPKLADFDISKALDVDAETSVMSSNVGTLAFKAPEFFIRPRGKLEYHRNVDVYAAGLTFLAMIQAAEKRGKLLPHIETPQDDSELHVQSIGQLIAERIKYNVPQLNIVVEQEKANAASSADDLKETLKKIIKKMTCVDPKERLTANQVELHLEKVSFMYLQN